MLSDLLILSPAVLGLLVLLGLRYFRPRAKAEQDSIPANAIVVDGSNVLHWGGDPSLPVLLGVLRSLDDKDYQPIVFFDANVGYLIGDRYFDAAMIAHVTDVPERQICVVDKGVVADEAILTFATDHALRVVTNDRFRDWRVRFPHAAKKRRLVGGTWRDGAVVWRGRL